MIDWTGKEIVVAARRYQDVLRRAAELKPPYDEVISLETRIELFEGTDRIRNTSYECSIVTGERLPLTFDKYTDILTRRFAPRDRLPPARPSDPSRSGPTDPRHHGLPVDLKDNVRFLRRGQSENAPSQRYTRSPTTDAVRPLPGDVVVSRDQSILDMAEAIRKGRLALYHEICGAGSAEEAQEIIRRHSLNSEEEIIPPNGVPADCVASVIDFGELRPRGAPISIHACEKAEAADALRQMMRPHKDGDLVFVPFRLLGEVIALLEAPNITTTPFNGFAENGAS